MYAEFKLIKAQSWNNGKGGAPYMWLVYIDDKKTPYCGSTLKDALGFISQFEQ